jgi:hypothetical protein
MNHINPVVVASVVVLLIAIHMGVKAWRCWQTVRQFLRLSVQTTGVIVGYTTIDPGDGAPLLYVPHVRYQDQHGVSYAYEDSRRLPDQPFPVGTTVPVRYDPQQDRAARTDSFWSLFTVPVVWCGGSIVLFMIGIVSLLAELM